ncbi:UDP-4-amino-4,6-dideoxy-N-acetyl-beta-L-altrosamine transaminase [Thermopetrobacter sp. TC1]|uniref:UDP-4-amino-4, 6-dideoxy-N-acetyl-beta-L-altrosamine transaminase n=1 Tax=Thermopetrobacter sp. TC1 TaxID=1495045 RepID=UPI0005702B98|nr:UDP-4-amino-4,6-dideoxy-N-acetyl-beta-L-altrosamine transaminase [Thermopetrobacter sp. TC1]
MLPYGRQEVTEEDIAAVVRVLKSDFLTQGPEVPHFEKAVAERCGARHAVATNSGTAALHVACLALGLGPGDILWTTPITFVASANCGLYCGAEVDFVDIDPVTRNISPDAFAEKLQTAEKAGRLPKVLVVVHFAGRSAEMREIAALAKAHGIRIIEDAAHALGGAYEGRPIGCCAWSDITTFSFHPVKIITSAEGGMALTNDAELAERMRLYRTHGITRDAAKLMHDDAPWYYEQQALGMNYRMPDVLAALGRSQLGRLTRYVDARARLAARYDQALADLPLRLPLKDDATHRSAWHLYVVELDDAQGAPSRRSVFEKMRASGIGVQVHYIPVHLQPHYRRLGFGPGLFPAAESYYERAMSLPLFPTMTDADQDQVIDALRGILG